MKIHFYLKYATRFGESFSLLLDGKKLPLEYLSDDLWLGVAELNPKTHAGGVAYSYLFHTVDGLTLPETDPGRRIDWGAKAAAHIDVYDYFNAMAEMENVFLTQPFTQHDTAPAAAAEPKHCTHIFRVKAPMLKKDESMCLLGHTALLRNWDTAAPILLKNTGDWWETRLDLSGGEFPLGYKYGVWNHRTHKFLGFEDGGNRSIPQAHAGALTIFQDNFARLPFQPWKGAGVAIPVFSLRTQKSWGVGEFNDLPLLADWAKSVGLKLIQLLPINDTTATHTWVDSYPYSAISAFALHPQFVNVEQIAGKADAALLKPYLKKQKALNALPAVDYESVLQVKWEILKQLYEKQKAAWSQDAEYAAYFEANRHWLAPYAVFCWLRDKHGTPDFSQWGKNAVYEAATVEKLLSPKNKDYDQIAIHLFVQWHLHLQLKAAVDYLHAQGLSLKGDIPIGIYRHSCDAWVAPELYNMNAQAGAPPDDFAENGQNWGFPTYNWPRMKADDFAWWKQRFAQMSLYFDAFRIDHILGFFRIWSIPLDAVEGIIGQFDPAIPLTEADFRRTGIGFDAQRLSRPFITESVLHETFGAAAAQVAGQFLDAQPDGQYLLKPDFDSQQKVQVWFDKQPAGSIDPGIRTGLFQLITNVILLPVPGQEGAYAFRFNMEKTASFRYLPAMVQGALKEMYVQYFYRKQDDFWRREALEKLPALKAATRMLICGEDLGMVPACVPEVMETLGILSLEIQRMPKALGATFFHPKDAPYRSVVTPSTHDMSTLRGWWEENRELTRRFYREILQQNGEAPYFCEPWVNKMILEQHFHSPAMWAIFQLQDLMGMDGALRRENPEEERINIPAIAKHYWRYRMHLTLENLMEQGAFNGELRRMVGASGRS